MSNFLNHEKLETAIRTMVAEKLSSDAMTEQISATLDKTVKGAIEDALRPYSDVGKAVNEAVKNALMIDDALGLPAYNETVKRIVRDKVQQHVNCIGKQKLQDNLDELFEIAPPKIKLSELVERFKEEELLKEDYESGEITLIVGDTTYGSTWVYLDADENTKMHQCRISMLVGKDGTVSSGRLGYVAKFDKAVPIIFGERFGFEKLIFNLHACGSRLIIDEDECDRTYGPEYN